MRVSTSPLALLRARPAPARAQARHAADDGCADLRRLGEALRARSEDVIRRIELRRDESESGRDGVLDGGFAHVAAVWTDAVSRWMAGEGVEVARETGQGSEGMLTELAASRAAPLDEMTRRCLRWRDAAADVASDSAAQLGLPPAVLSEALRMLQRSLDVTLVRMCECFESERRRADQELTFMATHDALTGLPNRALIAERMQQVLECSRRERTSVAVVFIDVDDFKVVNDTLGHSAGDELLRAVTGRLEAVVRHGDALGRLGGDEFVVIVDELTFDVGAEVLAERLLRAFTKPFTLAGGSARLNVTASIGVASGAHESAEELLREADIAMYRAKWSGKNRYAMFRMGARAGRDESDPSAARAPEPRTARSPGPC